MQGKTHMMGGLVTGLVTMKVMEPTLPTTLGAAFIGAAVLGSLFCDIDMTQSTIGRRAKPASLIVSTFFSHRTITHAPITILAIYLLIRLVSPASEPMAFYFALGAGSHILLDMLNKKGVPLLYPIPYRFNIASFKNGSMEEYFIRGALALTAMILAADITAEKLQFGWTMRKILWNLF